MNTTDTGEKPVPRAERSENYSNAWNFYLGGYGNFMDVRESSIDPGDSGVLMRALVETVKLREALKASEELRVARQERLDELENFRKNVRQWTDAPYEAGEPGDKVILERVVSASLGLRETHRQIENLGKFIGHPGATPAHVVSETVSLIEKFMYCAYYHGLRTTGEKPCRVAEVFVAESRKAAADEIGKLRGFRKNEEAPKDILAIEEAHAALLGAREVLGDVANIQHAIDLLCDAKQVDRMPCPPEAGTWSKESEHARRLIRKMSGMHFGQGGKEWMEAWIEDAGKRQQEAPKTFVQDLAALINRHSLEGASNTPDFILADFLQGALEQWNHSIVERAKWYGGPAEKIRTPDLRFSETGCPTDVDLEATAKFNRDYERAMAGEKPETAESPMDQLRKALGLPEAYAETAVIQQACNVILGFQNLAKEKAAETPEQSEQPGVFRFRTSKDGTVEFDDIPTKEQMARLLDLGILIARDKEE